MTSFWKWGRKRSSTYTDIKTDHSDTLKVVDESLKLLQTTTAEVSKAAVAAAYALQSKLDDSERRFHSTIDSLVDLIIIKDGDGRWKTINEAAVAAFGFQDHEYVGKTDVEIAEMFPHLQSTMMACNESDSQAWESRQPVRTQETIQRLGETDQYFDVIKTPIFENDIRKEIVVAGRDITEIKERNRRTKACFEAMNSVSDIIFICDRNSNIFFCNDPFLHYFKHEDYNEVVGKPVRDVVPDFVDFNTMWETISNNKPWHGKYNQHFEITVVPVMNGVPKPIYYVCTIKPKVHAT
jgi:PAS domain S-box-containing protein